MPEPKIPFITKVHRTGGKYNETTIEWTLKVDESEFVELGKDIEIIINYGGETYKDSICPVKP